jgi:phosphoserine phosphatase
VSDVQTLQRVLVTVTGPDTVGITATMTAAVAENHAELLDIEQVVVQGQLTLCLLVGVERGVASGEPVLKDLLFTAKAMGLDLDFLVLDDNPGDAPPAVASTRYAVTAISMRLDAGGVHMLSRVLADHGTNIESIRRLSQNGLSSLEVICTLKGGPEQGRALRAALMEAAAGREIDVAVQRERLTRRSKRLIVMDMDSTLIQIECIDELARMHGVVDRVASITARAMAGELDFEESLRERVRLLAGMEYEKALSLAANLPITEGAQDLLEVLRVLGYKTAVISGGFTFAAEKLKAKLGLDYAYANELEVKHGRLTGEVVGRIVGPTRKAELLEDIAAKERISLEQAIAIGDGANDLAMLERAGLGIAFHAKAKLRAAADTSVSGGGLDRILYLLGLHGRDVREILARRSR